MGIRSTSEYQVPLRPTEEQRAEITKRIAAYSRSLESRNSLTVDDLQALKQEFGLDKPATTPATPAAIETTPATTESPGLQWLKAQFQQKSEQDALLSELQQLHDRSALWPLTKLRDVVQAMGIQIFVADEISMELRQRLGMAADTAAAADVERKWIIVDARSLSKGCSQANVHFNAGLAAGILHEVGHVQLGHEGSDRLTLSERIGRERTAWGYGELMISRHSLHCYCQPHTLRRMEQFALNTYLEAVA